MSPDETTTDIARYRAPGALYAKRPAKATPMNRTELMSAGRHERWALVATANRLQRRGEITILRREVWSEQTGQWSMVIRRLKPAPPAWRKPLIVGGIALGTLSALFAAGWWALATLATLPGVIFLAMVLAAFVGMLAANGRNGSPVRVIEVITRITIR